MLPPTPPRPGPGDDPPPGASALDGADASALDRLLRQPNPSVGDRARQAVASAVHRWPPAALVGAAVVAITAGAVAVSWARSGAHDPALDLPQATTTAPAPDAPGGGAAPPGGAAPGPGTGETIGEGSVNEPTVVVVHVDGAVLAPGVVSLPDGSRITDAVVAAGGLAPDADTTRLNLAEPLADGARVWVPRVGQDEPDVVAPVGPSNGPGTGSGTSNPGGAGGAGAAAVVDINTADAAELDGLPGVGPATALAIIEHRDANGAFTSVDQLLDVRGIGEAKLEQIRPLVRL